MDPDALKRFLLAVPPVTGPELDAAARKWLADNGLAVGAGDGPPCTLVVLAVDAEAGFRAYAIPQAELDASAHADLARVNGRCFEQHFDADLAPGQFAGAFRILGGTAASRDAFEALVDTLREEMDDEAPEMDWDALIDGVGSWTRYRLSGGGSLPGPIARCYTAHLAT